METYNFRDERTTSVTTKLDNFQTPEIIIGSLHLPLPPKAYVHDPYAACCRRHNYRNVGAIKCNHYRFETKRYVLTHIRSLVRVDVMENRKRTKL